MELTLLRLFKLAPYRCARCETRFLDFKGSPGALAGATEAAVNH
jgi:hypothetical protein